MGERARSRITGGPPAHSVSRTAGALAASAWLTERGMSVPTMSRWHAVVLLATDDQTPELEIDDARHSRFRIEVYSEEWGFFFCHGGRASWIRVTDVAFVHGRDDFRLLPSTPPLREVGVLLRRLEAHHALRFRREHAHVRTNVASAEPVIRRWLRTL